MDNTPPAPFDGQTANEEAQPESLTLEKLLAVTDKFAAEQFDHDKTLIKALYASGFRVLVGGSRSDLPAAILPSSFARAHEAVLEEQRAARGQPRPLLFQNPFLFDGNMMS